MRRYTLNEDENAWELSILLVFLSIRFLFSIDFLFKHPNNNIVLGEYRMAFSCIALFIGRLIYHSAISHGSINILGTACLGEYGINNGSARDLVSAKLTKEWWEYEWNRLRRCRFSNLRRDNNVRETRHSISFFNRLVTISRFSRMRRQANSEAW